MGKKRRFTKILTILGTIFVWLPIVAPVLFSGIRYFECGRIFFDYLMPAELFPVALLGGGLLMWAALRSRIYRKLICWSFSLATGSLILGQLIAVVTGLASGEVGPSGWQWTLVLLSLIMYILALIGIGIEGLFLLRTIFRRPRL